jgi:hypothetical protein
MRKLLTKIIIILFILGIVDWLAGILLDRLLENSPDGRYLKTKYSLQKCNEDIVVIGSSRGEINYIPKILEDSIGMSCWNASRGGQGMPYFRAVQEGILSRYTPKLVILNIDDNDLESPPNYEHAGVLRPFYKSSPQIQAILNETSTFEWILLNSRLYAYNSSFYYLIRPYFYEGLDGKSSDKGWKPRLGRMAVEMDKKLEILTEKIALDKKSVELFNTLVNKFKEKGTQIILVVSPNYGRSVDSSNAIQYLRIFSKKENIPLLIYSNDRNFITNPDYFIDPDHLNVEGAELFTKNLVQNIKPALLKNKLIPE